MGIAVGELVSNLRMRSETIAVKLGDVRLEADGILHVGDRALPWGDRNTQIVAGFLKGPGYKYYEREPITWQSRVVAHHVEQNSDTESIWYLEGNSISGIYHSGAKIIPLSRVAERVAAVFDPTDVADVLFSPDQVEINVISKKKTVTVLGIPGVDSRPMEGTVLDWDEIPVGDISAGGVRVILYPTKPLQAPIVEEFWERKVCSNGMTRRINGSQVSMRSRTVDQIMAEMENVMRTIYEELDSSAQAILHSSQTEIPGAVSDYLRQVARERNVNAHTIIRLQDRAAALPVNPTVYDVAQVITEMASQEGLPVATRRNLQALGGDLVINPDKAVHRCVTCERPLDS